MAKKPVRDASHHLSLSLLCDETKEESRQYVLARAWLGPVAATEIRAASNRIVIQGGAIAAAAKSAPADFLG